MLRFALVMGMILILIAGCGSPQGSIRTVSPGQPQSTAVSDSPAQAASPPLTIRLLLDQQRLAVGSAMPLTLQATLEASATTAIGSVAASGVATVAQPSERTWRNVMAQQTIELQTTIDITGLGPGQITGTVQIVDAAGTVRYGRDTTIYVLATEQGVLTGTQGPQLLKREQLAQEHAAGRLIEEEYQRALEQLQYGGAQESITVVVPTSVP